MPRKNEWFVNVECSLLVEFETLIFGVLVMDELNVKCCFMVGSRSFGTNFVKETNNG